jgi:fatty-acyl-CoA synthase
MINVGEWIKKWSHLQPRKKALIFEDQAFAYQTVNLRVNQLCHLFLQMGINKGDRVSVLLRNCNQYVEIFFALSKIGAILVPLNWRLVEPELQFIIKDSGSRTLIFETEFVSAVHSIRSGLPISSGNYLAIGPNTPDWAKDYEMGLLEKPVHEPSLPYPVGGEDPHIIMYTSGTTGVPKGAILSHRKTFFNVLNADIFNNLTSNDIIIVSRPMFHSGGLIVESLPVLYKGGTVILKRRFRPNEILETIQKYQVTVLDLPVTIYQLYLQQYDLTKYNLKSLRSCFTGGERIPMEMLKEYYKKGIVIAQIFGQTECSTITSLSTEDAILKMGSVGLPVFHGEVRIVDKTGRDVNPGEIGEIIINGPTLMSGYWKRPDLTAETIRDGWLYTGDLAKMDEEGYFYIMDRGKDMYISGGENVYPAEIERVLHTHSKIFDVGIVGVPDENGRKWGRPLLC